MAFLTALADHFPGRLHVDPFDPGINVREPAELGPLIAFIHRLGSRGLDAALPHLDSPYPAYRYAAALLFSLVPDVRALECIPPRLYDPEPRIRQLAIEALSPFVAENRFERVLSSLRIHLGHPILEVRRRAIQFLGTFRDVAAVPTLITLCEDHDVGDDAHQALRAITLQDFGIRARGWERWWGKAKKKTRIDWLIDGLSSSERDIRSLAIFELSQMTGNDFGYHPDGRTETRTRAIEVFAAWWHEQKDRQTGPSTSRSA